jgi:hypothetical protein
MLSVAELKKITAKAEKEIRRREEALKAEEEAKYKREVIEAAKKLEKEVKEAIAYVETEIEKAAKEGKHSYAYEGSPEVMKRLQAYFHELNPNYSSEKRSTCINYELGDWEDYYVSVINFYW